MNIFSNSFVNQRLNLIELVVKCGLAWSAVSYVAIQIFFECYNPSQTVKNTENKLIQTKSYQEEEIISMSKYNAIKMFALFSIVIIPLAIECIIAFGLLLASQAYFTAQHLQCHTISDVTSILGSYE
jgi:hypothetical protein